MNFNSNTNAKINLTFAKQNLLSFAANIVIIIIIVILILKYTYKNDMPVCTDYVFNSYLYIILTFSLMLLLIIFNNETNIFTTFMIKLVRSNSTLQNISVWIGFFIILWFGLRDLFPSINPNNTMTLHLAYLFFISLITIVLCVFKIDLSNSIGNGQSTFMMINDMLVIGGLWTIFVSIIVGLFCNNFLDAIQQIDWNFYSKNLLLIFVVFCIVGLIFITDSEKAKLFLSIGSILGYILLVFMLIANHLDIVQHAKICGTKLMPTPNYPGEGMGMVFKVRRYITDLILPIFTSIGTSMDKYVDTLSPSPSYSIITHKK